MAVDSNITCTLFNIFVKVVFIFNRVSRLEVVVFWLFFLFRMVFLVTTS